MLPLGDDNPTRLTPIVNWTIIAACTLTFIWQTSRGESYFVLTLVNYGLTPARILTGNGYPTFITNMFLHGGWSHLLGNMLFLTIFGDNIEDCCGHIRYLAFYIASGVAASALWMLTAWGSPYPAVGASGAISAVLGAYFILYPNVRIRTLMGVGFFWRVIRASIPLNTGVAYWAHIGGFLAGMALSKIIKPRLRRPQAVYDLENYR